MKLVKSGEGYKLIKEVLCNFRSPIDWTEFKQEVKKQIKARGNLMGDVAIDFLDLAIARDDINEIRKIFEEIFREEFEKEHHEDWIARIVMALEGLKDIFDIDILASKSKKVNPLSSSYFKEIYYISKSTAPILILGETGTSKELLAKSLHEMSDRRTKGFVEINCAAIPENLLESELFGHKKGAFTGANELRKGRFEIANGGTIFLDELGKMPKYLQAKLLKTIDEKEITRLGSNKPIKIDIRFITAIQPIDIDVKEDRILPDLLYRLGYPSLLRMPTLNERLGSNPRKIIMNSLKVVSKKFNLNYDGSIHFKTIEVLKNHRYEGNYRELENILMRAILSAKSHNRYEVLPEDLKLNNEITIRSKNMEVTTGDWKDVEDLKRKVFMDSVNEIKLKDVIEHANKVRASIVEEKVKEIIEKGMDIKRVLINEGLPEKSYQVFRKKVETITGKKFKDFKVT
ncbi:MAG: sigma-54-dependent Fis family transcriptional regulator [Syntrophaceae bacterium]|nr:sigma-54-dependent Fis family transcriptional regulator [Syntrophaceae bacterium]